MMMGFERRFFIIIFILSPFFVWVGVHVDNPVIYVAMYKIRNTAKVPYI